MPQQKSKIKEKPLIPNNLKAKSFNIIFNEDFEVSYCFNELEKYMKIVVYDNEKVYKNPWILYDDITLWIISLYNTMIKSYTKIKIIKDILIEKNNLKNPILKDFDLIKDTNILPNMMNFKILFFSFMNNFILPINKIIYDYTTLSTNISNSKKIKGENDFEQQKNDILNSKYYNCFIVNLNLYHVQIVQSYETNKLKEKVDIEKIKPIKQEKIKIKSLPQTQPKVTTKEKVFDLAQMCHEEEIRKQTQKRQELKAIKKPKLLTKS